VYTDRIYSEYQSFIFAKKRPERIKDKSYRFAFGNKKNAPKLNTKNTGTILSNMINSRSKSNKYVTSKYLYKKYPYA